MEKIKYFNPEEIKKILSNKLKTKDYKKYLLCMLLAYTGGRISEVLLLQKSDIVEHTNPKTNETEYYIRLFTKKQIKKKDKDPYRYLPMHQKLQTELLTYILLKKLNDKDKLFTITVRTAQNWIKEACELAGFIGDDRSHPHSFRHSFAIVTLLNKNDIKLRVLQKWLGHSKIENTLIYQDIVARDTNNFMKDF